MSIPWFSRAALCSLQALISCSFLSLSSALSDGATHTHTVAITEWCVVCEVVPGVSADGVGSGTPFLAGVCFPFLAGLPYTEHNTHTHTLSDTHTIPPCLLYIPSLPCLPSLPPSCPPLAERLDGWWKVLGAAGES